MLSPLCRVRVEVGVESSRQGLCYLRSVAGHAAKVTVFVTDNVDYATEVTDQAHRQR